MQETQRYAFNPWVRKIPWSRKWKPIPAFLPGKSHGQRSLDGGYSPWGHKESDTIEHHHHSAKSNSMGYFYLLGYSYGIKQEAQKRGLSTLEVKKKSLEKYFGSW